jgi:hypothetical protein
MNRIGHRLSLRTAREPEAAKSLSVG